MELELMLLSLILCLSATFSGSETAVLSINSGKLEALKSNSPKFYQKVRRFTDFPYRFLLFILLSNTAVNIWFASSAEKVLGRYMPFFSVGLTSEIAIFVLTTFILLVFGEVVPKAIAINYPEKVLELSSMVLVPLSYILFPILKFFNFLEIFFNNIKTIIKPYSLERGSLEAFAEVASGNTEIDERQRFFLKIAYGLDSIFNMAVMKAIIDLPTELSSENIGRVRSGEIPFIVVLNEKNGEPHTIYTPITGFKKRVKDDDEFIVVASCHSVYSTLKKMLNSGKQYAIVIDEYGLWRGYIAYEHIFNFISKDIMGIKAHVNSAKKGTIIDTSETIAQLAMDHGYKFTLGNYTTLNGYITAKLGFIPQQGYEFESDGLKIKVLESTKTKTKKVKIDELN